MDFCVNIDRYYTFSVVQGCMLKYDRICVIFPVGQIIGNHNVKIMLSTYLTGGDNVGYTA